MNRVENPLLLVDPYKNLLHAYRILFEEMGIPVETAANLEEARRRLSGKNFSVILSELFSAENDGLSFWQELKSRHPELYLILLTDAMIDEEGYEKIFRSGADDLIIKPFSPEKLLVHVRRGLRHRALILEQQRQEQLALLDPLSPSLNRIILNGVYFRQCFRQELKRARRHGEPLSVLLMSANGKTPSGEPIHRFLEELAGLVRNAVREEDIMGRENGGFGLLLVKTDRRGTDVLRSRLANLIQCHSLFQEDHFLPFCKDLTFKSFTYPDEQAVLPEPFSGILEEISRENPLN